MAKPKVVDFELDWSSSKNLEADLGEGDFKVHANPFQRIKLGRLVRTDPTGGWSLSTGMSWSLRDDEVSGEIATEEGKKKIIIEIDAQKELVGQSGLIPDVDPIEQVRQSITAFVDLEFPPSMDSVAMPTKVDDTASKVSWRRASSIFDTAPEIFADNPDNTTDRQVEPSDIQQGALGDCA